MINMKIIYLAIFKDYSTLILRNQNEIIQWFGGYSYCFSDGERFSRDNKRLTYELCRNKQVEIHSIDYEGNVSECWSVKIEIKDI